MSHIYGETGNEPKILNSVIGRSCVLLVGDPEEHEESPETTHVGEGQEDL